MLFLQIVFFAYWFGAADQIRTGDLILTKDAICRLAVAGDDPERLGLCRELPPRRTSAGVLPTGCRWQLRVAEGNLAILPEKNMGCYVLARDAFAPFGARPPFPAEVTAESGEVTPQMTGSVIE